MSDSAPLRVQRDPRDASWLMLVQKIPIHLCRLSQQRSLVRLVLPQRASAWSRARHFFQGRVSFFLFLDFGSLSGWRTCLEEGRDCISGLDSLVSAFFVGGVGVWAVLFLCGPHGDPWLLSFFTPAHICAHLQVTPEIFRYSGDLSFGAGICHGGASRRVFSILVYPYVRCHCQSLRARAEV